MRSTSQVDGPQQGRLAGLREDLACRPMSERDLDAVMQIERAIYPFPWSRGNFADSIASGYDAWVFETGAQVIGYAVVMWLPDEVHLLNISVTDAQQGRGFGRGMLRALCRDACLRGARSMLLEVRPSNLAAHALYLSEGFALIGQRRAYYPAPGDTREDALVMRKELSCG